MAQNTSDLHASGSSPNTFQRPRDRLFYSRCLVPRDPSEATATNRVEEYRPKLRLPDASICLHVLQVDSGQGTAPNRVAPASGNSPTWFSYENDLLAMSFQRPGVDPGNAGRVAHSVHAAHTRQSDRFFRVRVHFPRTNTFVSEGRSESFRVVDDCRVMNTDGAGIDTRCYLSCTQFPFTGIAVWHLVFRPCESGSFNEYDLIRFIKLYNHVHEQTRLHLQTTFEVSSLGITVDCVEKLLDLLLGGVVSHAACVNSNPGAGDSTRDFRVALVGGTVEVITDPVENLDLQDENDSTLAGKALRLLLHCRNTAESGIKGGAGNLLELLFMYTKPDRSHVTPESVEQTVKLAKRIRKETGITILPAQFPVLCDQLKALVGVISGIFDFREMDAFEALDTVATQPRDSTQYIGFQRRTLACLIPRDRAKESADDRIGISPYLLLPHAVVIYNESILEVTLAEVIGRLEKELSGALTCRRLFMPTRRLETTLLEMQHVLHQKLGMLMPQVFHYNQEKELISAGLESRGFSTMQEAAASVTSELDGIAQLVYATRKGRADMGLTLLIAGIGLIQLIPVARSFLLDGATKFLWSPAGISSVIILSILLLVIPFQIFRKRRNTDGISAIAQIERTLARLRVHASCR